MNKLTRFNHAPSFAQKAAVFAAAALAAGTAAAQDLAAAVTSEVDTAVLLGIGVVVLGIAGILLMIRSGRKAAN